MINEVDHSLSDGTKCLAYSLLNLGNFIAKILIFLFIGLGFISSIILLGKLFPEYVPFIFNMLTVLLAITKIILTIVIFTLFLYLFGFIFKAIEDSNHRVKQKRYWDKRQFIEEIKEEIRSGSRKRK